MANENSKSNGYAEALKTAEANLSFLRAQTGGDEVARMRKIRNQEVVVKGLRRMVRHSGKIAA